MKELRNLRTDHLLDLDYRLVVHFLDQINWGKKSPQVTLLTFDSPDLTQ